MSVTFAPHIFATAAVVSEGRHLDSTEHAVVRKSLRTSEWIAFALVSLAVFTVVAVMNMSIAAFVAFPLLAVGGIALNKGQDARIGHEIEIIELELASID